MDAKEFRQYKMMRTSMIFNLENSWPYLQEKIELLIKDASATKLGTDKAGLLTDALSNFTETVYKVINPDFPHEDSWEMEYESNLKFESKFLHDVAISLPDLYADIFFPFFKDVKFIAENEAHIIMPDSKKFRFYNLDLRHPLEGRSPNFEICDVDNAFNLHNKIKHKSELMQGYWETESMVREIRNLATHWKRDGRKFLESDLGRTMKDPISNAPSSVNFFTIVSELILMAHQFIEILQTWLDTCRLVDRASV